MFKDKGLSWSTAKQYKSLKYQRKIQVNVLYTHKAEMDTDIWERFWETRFEINSVCSNPTLGFGMAS